MEKEDEEGERGDTFSLTGGKSCGGSESNNAGGGAEITKFSAQ